MVVEWARSRLGRYRYCCSGVLKLRGEICLVNLDPVIMGEPATTRPAVIVSNDAANTVSAALGRGVITVVSITSNIDRVYPFQVFLDAAVTGLDTDSKAQVEQVRAVSVQRVGGRLGGLSAELPDQLNVALRLHLML
jgi:mRNA interferase MazF